MSRSAPRVPCFSTNSRRRRCKPIRAAQVEVAHALLATDRAAASYGSAAGGATPSSNREKIVWGVCTGEGGAEKGNGGGGGKAIGKTSRVADLGRRAACWGGGAIAAHWTRRPPTPPPGCRGEKGRVGDA